VFTAGADALMLDLEDAVPPQHKADARRMQRDLPDGEFVDLPVAQRARRVLQLAEAVSREPVGV